VREERKRNVREERKRNVPEERKRNARAEIKKNVREERKRNVREERRRNAREERRRNVREERRRNAREERRRNVREERRRNVREERKRNVREERKRNVREERKRNAREDGDGGGEGNLPFATMTRQLIAAGGTRRVLHGLGNGIASGGRRTVFAGLADALLLLKHLNGVKGRDGGGDHRHEIIMAWREGGGKGGGEPLLCPLSAFPDGAGTTGSWTQPSRKGAKRKERKQKGKERGGGGEGRVSAPSFPFPLSNRKCRLGGRRGWRHPTSRPQKRCGC
jgi:hypothetical protein